jgi:hypothetical protein
VRSRKLVVAEQHQVAEVFVETRPDPGRGLQEDRVVRRFPQSVDALDQVTCVLLKPEGRQQTRAVFVVGFVSDLYRPVVIFHSLCL